MAEPSTLQAALARIEALEKELRVAESFHRVAVRERDAERIENQRIRAELEKLGQAEISARTNCASCLDTSENCRTAKPSLI